MPKNKQYLIANRGCVLLFSSERGILGLTDDIIVNDAKSKSLATAAIRI